LRSVGDTLAFAHFGAACSHNSQPEHRPTVSDAFGIPVAEPEPRAHRRDRNASAGGVPTAERG